MWITKHLSHFQKNSDYSWFILAKLFGTLLLLLLIGECKNASFFCLPMIQSPYIKLLRNVYIAIYTFLYHFVYNFLVSKMKEYFLLPSPRFIIGNKMLRLTIFLSPTFTPCFKVTEHILFFWLIFVPFLNLLHWFTDIFDKH